MPSSAQPQESTVTKADGTSSQPAGATTADTSVPQRQSIAASENGPDSPGKSTRAKDAVAAQASKPQDAPVPSVPRKPWHVIAWGMIKTFARAMPKSDRETMLLGACLELCEKFPRITQERIKTVLSLHGKFTAAEQQRVLDSVEEYIAEREEQALVEKVQKRAVKEGGTTPTAKVPIQPQVTATSKPMEDTARPARPALPKEEVPVDPSVAKAANVSTSAPSRASKAVAAPITSVPKMTHPASGQTPNEKVTEAPDGSAISSALQEYCTMLADKARGAEEHGEFDQRDAIQAELRAPVGDQLASLRQWLVRNHPTVARKIHDLLCAPLKAKASKSRLSALEDVFRNLPVEFVKYRLGIDGVKSGDDTVVSVADAMHCTRHEAIKRLVLVLPDLMQFENSSAIKDTAWLDRIAVHDHQMQACIQQKKENNYVIRPE